MYNKWSRVSSSERFTFDSKSITHDEPHSVRQNPEVSEQETRTELSPPTSSKLFDSDVVFKYLQNLPSNHRKKLDLRLLILDNYDSYTYNLFSYLSTICIHPPTVISNDAYHSWEDLLRHSTPNSCASYYDGIIISPGPGRPEHPQDIGICLEVIEKNQNIPILGVCLGHQALGYYYNCTVQLAPYGPVHGLLSRVWHNESNSSMRNTSCYDMNKNDHLHCNLFDGIPQFFHVVRYHSLVVQFPTIQDIRYDIKAGVPTVDIEPIAWCRGDSRTEDLNTSRENTNLYILNDGEYGDDVVCMALRHKNYPHYGVQFHPESIGTGLEGYQLLKNFCDFCVSWRKVVTKNQVMGPWDKRVQSVLSSTSDLATSLDDNSKVNTTTDTTGNVIDKYQVFVQRVGALSFLNSSPPCPEQVFENFYEQLDDSFWLDSSTGRRDADKRDTWTGNLLSMSHSDCPVSVRSRFSILGGNTGPLCKRLEYYGSEHTMARQGLYVWTRGINNTLSECTKVNENLLPFLQREIGCQAVLEYFETIDENTGLWKRVDERCRNSDPDNFLNDEVLNQTLPFDYRGGWVGYLGYEVRHETHRSVCDQENFNEGEDFTHGQVSHTIDGLQVKSRKLTTNQCIPTAAFLFADRSLLYDHWRGDWYVIGVASSHSDNSGRESTLGWMSNVIGRLKTIRPLRKSDALLDSYRYNNINIDTNLDFQLLRSKKQYEADISRCLVEIENGESYELCLTNQFKGTFQNRCSDNKTPLGLYKILRRINPAPYAAFLNFCSLDRSKNTHRNIPPKAAVAICCSSPELFLSVTKATRDDIHDFVFSIDANTSLTQIVRDLYRVESKPIKGTTARFRGIDNFDNHSTRFFQDAQLAEELRLSEKNRAENLMIVDLLRNDLSRVCEPGSVYVPRLMQIETFATVHQLVSTIRGLINLKRSNAVDVVAACFPGGSMTGAPKLRTVNILDQIEGGYSRGPYSGCLGYFSLNGCMEMNIVIRTAVVTPSPALVTEDLEKWEVAIGAGGAITALSDHDHEFDEMLLKAKAIIDAVRLWQS